MTEMNNSIENFCSILNEVEERINDLEGDAGVLSNKGNKKG